MFVAALRAILLEKENILSKIHYDLDGLQEYKVIHVSLNICLYFSDYSFEL